MANEEQARCRVNVVYMVNGQVGNFPVIEGEYITVNTTLDGRANVQVWTKKHGDLVRAVTFQEFVSVDWSRVLETERA